MVQYFITYSVQTGKEMEHEEWLRRVGLPFWERQPGFRGLHAFSTLIGDGPDWVLEVEFASAEDLVRALASEEAQRVLETFEHMVRDLETKVLQPAAL